MKKWLGVIIATLFSCGVFADAPMYAPVLKAKFIGNSKSYYVLSDGSHWQVVGFEPRMRGLSEWWNDVQLAPDIYRCVPSDWAEGVPVAAYMKYGNLTVDENNAANQELLKQCSNLLVNQGNGQILFAIPLDPISCFLQACQEAENKGYKKGYAAKYIQNQQENNARYDEGYRIGYDAGSRLGKTAQDKDYKDSYEKGYKAGLADQHKMDTQDQSSQNNKKYEEGYRAGLADQRKIDAQNQSSQSSKKYEEGYRAGLADQHTIEAEQAKAKYAAGYKDGCEKGYAAGSQGEPPPYTP